MAYQTGSAATLADLLTSLRTFCTTNGWTLAGDVLSKGTCYTRLLVVGTGIEVLGGAGIDVGNGLTTPGPAVVNCDSPLTGEPVTWPVAYHFHATGNEVYAVCNFSVTGWVYLAFGASPVAGLPGTGGWYSASLGGAAVTILSWATDYHFYTGSSIDYNDVNATGLGWCDGNASTTNTYVHHGLDAGAWSAAISANVSGPVSSACAKTSGIAGPLLVRQPNAWNGESILIPVQPYIDRTSNKTSIIADLAHARYINIGNLDPGATITLGADTWRVYPFYRKGAVLAPGTTDSGWLGLACRQ